MLILRIVKRIIAELFVHFPIIKSGGTKGITVSFTSYPARMGNLHLVVRSLLHQSIKPERIVLYLGTDTPEKHISPKLKKLKKHGLIIKTGYEDLKPHKKYFFAMQEYPENTIITVDDDLIYDRNLIKDLLKCSYEHPNCVCARRVNLMTKHEDKSLAKYSDWKWEYKKLLEPSHALLATGCGGVLYPPHCFGPAAFDIEAIKENCLNTDDIWLKFMEIKYNRKVVFTNSIVCHPLTIRNSQKSALMLTNTSGENRNDINIKNMENFTDIKLADYAYL